MFTGSRPDRRGRQRHGGCGPVLVLGLLTTAPSLAQDANRGASLYLQLPRGLASCVSCHGPDPTQNRNRLLLAADRPEALLRALNTVGVMGYLRSELSDTDVIDLAAYLGRVLIVSSDSAPLALWPSTIEFGALAPGRPSAPFRVRLANRSATAQPFSAAPRADPSVEMRHDCPAVLAPGAFCELRLQLPSAGGADAGGGLTWAWADPGGPLLTAWSAAARSAGSLSVEPEAGLDFGQTLPGIRVDREVVLRSIGPVPVTLGLATLTGPDRARFALGSGCAAGTVLPPGSACSMTVSYQPAVAGVARAGLQWRSDGRNPSNLMLDGRAVVGAPPPASPAPPTPPSPSPSPAPVPAPSLVPTTEPSTGGGGCAVATPTQGGTPPRPRPDPVLPGLSVIALVALLLRRMRRARGRGKASPWPEGLSRFLHGPPRASRPG